MDFQLEFRRNYVFGSWIFDSMKKKIHAARSVHSLQISWMFYNDVTIESFKRWTHIFTIFLFPNTLNGIWIWVTNEYCRKDVNFLYILYHNWESFPVSYAWCFPSGTPSLRRHHDLVKYYAISIFSSKRKLVYFLFVFVIQQPLPLIFL